MNPEFIVEYLPYSVFQFFSFLGSMVLFCFWLAWLLLKGMFQFSQLRTFLSKCKMRNAPRSTSEVVSVDILCVVFRLYIMDNNSLGMIFRCQSECRKFNDQPFETNPRKHVFLILENSIYIRLSFIQYVHPLYFQHIRRYGCGWKGLKSWLLL